MSFRVVPIDPELVAEVRATLQTPGWNYPAAVETATGYGPCRSCMQVFELGVDRRIFFTHDAFEGREPLPLPGPVYIHEDHCEPYAALDAVPASVRALDLTLNAYGAGRRLHAQERVEGTAVEAAVEQLFVDERVDYVHVHNTDVGCFLLRLDRSHANDERRP
ncbi:MAG: hypothetical protein JWO17_517 [Actinomycetia bacterium]|nr:hypothetical protein [Actinomycetes bacterium]